MDPEDVETNTVAPQPRAKRRVLPLPLLDRGTCVGRYVILDRLGVGGMGIVYRAYDPDLDRRVALKLVRAVTKETTTRMIREAQALAKVSHPNIVQVFDVGMFGETVFIALELVEGRTLWHWWKETKPTWRVLLPHLIEAGRGLAAAHAVGLVHRDFKPQNAIVGADGRVRVLDFGLARVASSPAEEEEVADDDTGGDVDSEDATIPVARSGSSLPQVVVSRITGTPFYMAPEQRKKGVLDARADQFAFGVSCWELLYGQRAFVGENLLQYTEASKTGQFRAPPAGSDTPAWVRRVLMRSLAPAPADRYPAMDDVLAALLADPARRRRKIAAVGLGELTAAGLITAFAMRSSAPAPCEDAARHFDGVWDPAVAARLEQAFRATGASFAPETARKVHAALDQRAAAWTGMHREACRATRVSGEQSAELLDLRMGCLARRRDELRALVDQLVAKPDSVRVAAAVEAVDHLPSVAACADRDALTAVVPLPDDPRQRAAIARARTELVEIHTLLDLGEWQGVRKGAEVAQQRARQIAWAPLVAEAGLVRGLAERNAGSFPAAEAALTETVIAAARAHLDDVSTLAWAELAWVVGYEQERTVEGLALASAAEAVALRADATPHELAGVAHTRALIWSTKGDQDAALREANRAVELLRTEATPDELEIADVLNTIGLVHSIQGDYVRAEQVHRQVLELRRAKLGEGHPKLADSLDNLGVDRFHQGAIQEARTDYEEALAIRVAALGPDSRDVGTSHNNIGGLLMDTGDAAGAAEHLTAALRIYEKTLGPRHGDLAIPLSNLGELATKRGAFDEALEYCTRALAIDEASAPEDPKLAYDLVCVAEAELGRKAPQAAQVALERALKLRENSAGDIGELARTRFDLARALWQLGAHMRAQALAIQARDGFAAAGDAWKNRRAETSAWIDHPE